LLLIVAQGVEQLPHFGGWIQGGELICKIVGWQCRLVPPLLIVGERGIERATTADSGVDRVGEQRRVAEGNADALRPDRILVVTGIAYQRPPGRRACGKCIVDRLSPGKPALSSSNTW
jgi:hypothetical protein